MSHLLDADDAAGRQAIDRTIQWLERAVIGLNLCPFAKAVHIKRQIRWVVSGAKSVEELLADLIDELRALALAEPESVATTVLIHPFVLKDFAEYNAFLDTADAAVEETGLEGELQVASFHPDYQFADSDPDDIENYSNRAPYPTLHLLREESIDRAVEAFPDAERIWESNIRTLRKLGLEGWRELFTTSSG